MKKFYAALITGILLFFFAGAAFGQQPLVTDIKKKELANLSTQAHSLYLTSRRQAISMALKNGWIISGKTKGGGIVSLQGVSKLGFPRYLITHDNIISAATTGTNTVQPGGSLGLNLSGSSTFLNNKLAIWDGGSVYKAHQEFGGKTITIKDQAVIIDHATHVSGTMLAKGVYPPAKGMAFNAATLISYDFNDDVAEMSNEASNLLLSNHSYGDEAGWNFNDTFGRWEWYGLPGDTVDYNFGFYNDRTQAWDQIAYSAPFYLIVESAGNARGSTGPAVGEPYYGFKNDTDQTIVSKGPRPANISSNGGYDCISTTGNAKNILTIGAINPLPNGPSNPQAIASTYFSSWGPTDDGRVKPDLVANGLNVLSSGSSAPDNYIVLSGTSMAAPNVTGSLYLLQEYYAKLNKGNFMRAATLKGLACHTAIDAGNAGPDYIYGWGLLNMKDAAQAITDNGKKSMLKENTLAQGQKQTFNVIASGNGSLIATISWTDPAGSITRDGTVNDRTPKLVNDLDIRVSDGTTTFTPWVLDPNNPSAAATKGDNIRDNIEQVYIAGATPGRAYTITVSHKGTLQSGSQDYSIIVTGIGGTTYCTSRPLSNADSRINNVKISNLDNTPPAGCTTYSDFSNLTVQLEQGKTYPLSLTLGTCGANFSKAAKVFIDWNGNGVFEPGELVATSTVINGTGSYSTNITVPPTVVPGNFSLMRVVLTETSDTSAITACGTFAKGETQDYRVQFTPPATDVGVVAIVSPAIGGTCSGTNPVTVTLKNFGTVTQSEIPVKVTITDQNGITSTFSQMYTSALTPGNEDNLTFNSLFTTTAGSTYVITAVSSLPGDLITVNNKITDTVLVTIPPVAGDLTANFCNVSKSWLLSGSGDGELLWYQNANDALPVAYGSPTVTSQAPVNNTYYAGLNDFSGTVGPATKNVFTSGSYDQFTPSVNVTTNIPVIIQSARLYIGYPGKITFSVSNTNGEIVSSTTLNVSATRSSPTTGTQADDPSDQGRVYDLNLLLPAAGNYSISASYEDNATIFRSNAGVTGYPFKIGNVFSITGNTATSNDTAYYKGFYYYLYDVQLKSPGCPSASRQAVIVVKPLITQNGTTLSSNIATGNQWYLNGTLISGATGQTYSPTQSGNYRVDATLSSGCIAQSDNYVYATINITPDNDIGLSIFPVPANDELNVAFAAKAASQLKLSLVNSAGRSVYSGSQTVSQGNFSTLIDVNGVAAGTYVLKVTLGQKVYARKVIIDR